MSNEGARLLRRLLDLAIAEGQAESIVEQALSHVIEACKAQVAYLELRDTDGQVVFVRGAGGDEASIEALRATTSSTIAARVLETGSIERTIAVTDPNFTDLDSVRRNAISAVVCAPIGSPPIGVLYMQRRDVPDPFDEEEQELVELFATVVARFAIPQLVATRPLSADAKEAESRRIRASLERHGGNKLAVARELEIAPSTLYRKLKSLGID